jgi:dolichol-phosphate mannosyltransferase
VNPAKGLNEKLKISYIKTSLTTSGHTGNQFIRFALVGSSGVLVNLAIYTGAIYLLDIYYLLAASLSFILAMTNNFVLNLRWTFKTHTQGLKSIRDQYLRYFLVTLNSYVINIVILWALVDHWHRHKVLSQLIAILITTLTNFFGSKLWAFKSNPKERLTGL